MPSSDGRQPVVDDQPDGDGPGEHLVLALPELHLGAGADVTAQLVAAVEQHSRMKGGAYRRRARSSRQLLGRGNGGQVGIGGAGVAVAAALLGRRRHHAPARCGHQRACCLAQSLRPAARAAASVCCSPRFNTGVYEGFLCRAGRDSAEEGQDGEAAEPASVTTAQPLVALVRCSSSDRAVLRTCRLTVPALSMCTDPGTSDFALGQGRSGPRVRRCSRGRSSCRPGRRPRRRFGRRRWPRSGSQRPRCRRTRIPRVRQRSRPSGRTSS